MKEKFYNHLNLKIDFSNKLCDDAKADTYIVEGGKKMKTSII